MSKTKKIWIGILIAVLCIGLGVGIYFLVINLQKPATNGKPLFPEELKICKKGEATPLENLSLVEGESADLVVVYEETSKELTFKYESSDQEIATINEQFTLNALKAGQIFLKVTCNEKVELTKTIIVEVLDKVEQKGVGSGRTQEDPLFIGNEGSTDPVEVHFIEVQRMYGDSIYIKKGLVDILIDGGTSDDGEHIKEFLNENMEDEILDLVIVTHTHEDHYGGMAKALEAVEEVSMFIDYGGDSKNTYSYKRDEFIAKGASYYSALDCVNYNNDAVKEWYLTSDFTVEVLNTGHYIGTEGSANNTESVATIFNYFDFSYFTAGDLTSDGERDLLKNESLSAVTLYKASHHGSHGSNTTELLSAIDPYTVGISAAIIGDTPEEQNGIKGHPAAEAVKRIFQAPQISKNHNVYWNGVNGDMCFSTYGGHKDLTFKGSPTKKGYYIQDETGTYVKVTGEDNLKFVDSKLFKIRGYDQFLI